MLFDSPLAHGKAMMRRMILPQPGLQSVTFRDRSPLVVAGMFRTGNGIGRAAMSCYEALLREGLSPLAVDLSDMFHQQEMESRIPLSPMPRSRNGTLILFANAPETQRALMGLGLRRWHNWRIIGAWAWELTVGPSGWARQARMLSEVWYPSHYVHGALHSQVSTFHRVVPHYVPAYTNLAPLKAEANNGTQLRVLSVADGRSSLPRKNLLAAIAMFRRAFPGREKVELCVKCRNLRLHPDYQREVMQAADEDARIRIIDRTMPQDEYEALLVSSDVVISAHRAEGFGLHLAEAMASGKAVIATGWSGNLEFMNPSNSILLPYRLTPVKDSSGIYKGYHGAQWAEAEIDAGAHALRDLYDSPSSLESIAEAGRRSIGRTLTSSRYTDALFDRLAHEAPTLAGNNV
ncbi:MAG: glycosyltransferase [Rhodobiaceae bacterium]|nr:glycosyltransferase [Rhodobiaceae bacterium]